MSYSDPISDMLTRIRNAQMANHEVVEMPSSKMKASIVKILKKEGYITDFTVEGGPVKKTLRIYLKYTEDNKPVISGLKRISKPGLRKYVSSKEIPVVLGGIGTAIISSSSGILSGYEAKKKNVGGEILCTVW